MPVRIFVMGHSHIGALEAARAGRADARDALRAAQRPQFAPPPAAPPRETQSEAYLHQMEALMRVHCDEVALDPG